MDQPPDSIRKQDINLTRLYYRRHFTFAEGWVNHGLAAAICARSIIRRADFCRSTTGRAALVGDARTTLRATHARDFSFLSDGSDDVTTLFAASEAHLFNSISNRKSFFLFHCYSFCRGFSLQKS